MLKNKNQLDVTCYFISLLICKLLMMDILMSETCWAHKKWNKIASDIKLVFYTSTITMMHGPINIRLNILCKGFHEKLIFMPLIKKFSSFYAIWMLSTLFTTFYHWFPSWERWLQSTLSYHIFQNIHCNISLLSTLKASKQSLPLMLND